MLKIKIQIQSSVSERLSKECKDAPRKHFFVRGHFRVVNGKKVYVKPHYRKG